MSTTREPMHRNTLPIIYSVLCFLAFVTIPLVSYGVYVVAARKCKECMDTAVQAAACEPNTSCDVGAFRPCEEACK